MYSFILLLLLRCSIISKNSTGTCYWHYAMVLGWSVGLSKEACLYVGTDWLKLIHQLEAGKRSVIQVSVDHAVPWTIRNRRLRHQKSQHHMICGFPSFRNAGSLETQYSRNPLIDQPSMMAIFSASNFCFYFMSVKNTPKMLKPEWQLAF